MEKYVVQLFIVFICPNFLFYHNIFIAKLAGLLIYKIYKIKYFIKI